MKKIKKIGIIAKLHKIEAKPILIDLINWLGKRGLEIVLDTDTADLVKWEGNICPRVQVPSSVDMIIVLGGDGTLLSVARLIKDNDVPILGVNLGGLGFLTEITLDELYQTLEKVLSNNFQVDERTMLLTYIHRQGKRISEYDVLNDVVFTKGALSRIIDLEVFIDGEYVTTYQSDGLIVATPTGSTAYSLSANGPIINPQTDAFVLTPICPHTLTNRPIVIPNDSEIKITLNTANEDVSLTLDGQIGIALEYKDIVEIRKSVYKTKLIRSASKNYYEILREKLKWGERY